MPLKYKKTVLDREFFFTSVFFLLCLLFYVLFPFHGSIQGYTKSFFFLVVLPAFYVRIIMRRHLGEFGFAFETNKKNVLYFFAVLTFSFFIILFFKTIPIFNFSYFLPSGVISNFISFLIYELVFINIPLLFFSIFFHGFLLFHLKKISLQWSFLLQGMFYAIILVLSYGFKWQIAPGVVSAFLGGYLAQKNNSWIYSYAYSLIYILVLDGYMIHTFK